MLRQEGGPTISEGVQIFLKYEVRGVQIFRNIWTGGIQSGGVQIFHDSPFSITLVQWNVQRVDTMGTGILFL